MPSTVEGGGVSDESKARENALRRKEKELEKKEQQVKQSTLELNSARDSVDFLMQELEARELVMNEAEEKHGSLLQREEDVDRQERDVANHERTVGIRMEEVARKDAQFEELERARQKEYEDKLFPLAAREQEIIRREAEVHTLEMELESKMRAFSRKLSSEEERDRQREKQNKEQETRLKENSAAVDKRHNEAETLLSQVNEKQKAVKAEQIEVESRDRDVKWRDDQLRVAHQEVHDSKNRLMVWEQELALREEEINVTNSDTQLHQTTLESRELELGERLSKVLSAEKEVKLREEEANGRLGRVENLESVATQRINSTQEREAKITADADAVQKKFEAAEKLLRDAEEREKSIVSLLTEVSERERALKDWIIELDYKEKQLATKPAHGGGGHNNSSSSGPAGGGAPVKMDSATLASMSLRQVQDKYIGANAKQSGKLAAKRNAKRQPVDLLNERDPFVGRAEELVAIRDLHVECRRLEKQFNDWVGRYYCIPLDQLEKFFSTNEQQQFANMLDVESRFDEEDAFLTLIIGDSAKSTTAVETGGTPQQGASVVPKAVDYTTVEEWRHHFKKVVRQAMQRRRDSLSTRVSRLDMWNQLFQLKDETFPEDFPKPPRAVLSMGSGTASLAEGGGGLGHHRIHRQTPKPVNQNHHTSAKKLRMMLAGHEQHGESGDEERDDRKEDTTESSTRPQQSQGAVSRRASVPVVGEHSLAVKRDAAAELSKIVESLPPYLRHHYDPPHE